jgi:hypothetical protein
MAYELDMDGIFRPVHAVRHRDGEYREGAFETLLEMQSKAIVRECDR